MAKIINIEKDEKSIYHVTLKPSLLGRIFGASEKVIKLKDSGREYVSGGQTVYINEKGEKIGNWSSIGEAIDNWRRRF